MMRRNTEIDRWLAEEGSGDETRAEAAFFAALARMPRLAPRFDFADRVLAALPVRARRPMPAMVIWHGAIAAALALIGAAVWFVPSLRWLPVETPRFAAIVKTWAVAMSAVLEWLQGGVAVWVLLLRIGRWVAIGIQAPEIAAGLVGSAVLGAAALYTLNHLLAPERSSWR